MISPICRFDGTRPRPGTPHSRLESAITEPARADAPLREIRDVTTRVGLAASIRPGQIPLARLDPEDSDLVAHLPKTRLLADDEAALSSGLMVDGPNLEAAIAAKDFATFVSPTVLNISTISNLL